MTRKDFRFHNDSRGLSSSPGCPSLTMKLLCLPREAKKTGRQPAHREARLELPAHTQAPSQQCATRGHKNLRSITASFRS